MHDNLRHLGLDVLDVVNLRTGAHEGTSDDSIAESFGALVELRQEGLIRHLGLSGVSLAQLTEAQAMAPVVTVQNLYNLANRADDALVDRCAAENIAFASFFPLGGFSPLQSETLTKGRGPGGRQPAAGGAGLVVAAFGDHCADPGYLVGRASAGEHRGR